MYGAFLHFQLSYLSPTPVKSLLSGTVPVSRSFMCFCFLNPLSWTRDMCVPRAWKSFRTLWALKVCGQLRTMSSLGPEPSHSAPRRIPWAHSASTAVLALVQPLGSPVQVTPSAASSRWQRVAVNVFKVTFPIGFIVMKHFVWNAAMFSFPLNYYSNGRSLSIPFFIKNTKSYRF